MGNGQNGQFRSAKEAAEEAVKEAAKEATKEAVNICRQDNYIQTIILKTVPEGWKKKSSGRMESWKSSRRIENR